MIELSEATRSILLIEDHRAVAERIGQHLESRRFDVDIACDGINGLRLARSRVYDAIVLDLTLPGMDGLEVCRELYGSTGCTTPVMLLAEQECVDESPWNFQAAADDFLIKPVSLFEFDVSLDRLLAGTDAAGESAAGRTGHRVQPQLPRAHTYSRDPRLATVRVPRRGIGEVAKAQPNKGHARA